MRLTPRFKSAQWISVLVVPLLLVLLGGPALAGPVDWREVPSSLEGQQWWDAGSVRRTRDGNVSVLSRYSLRTEDESPALGTLVVMEIDCDQRLYRDTQKNGLPRFKASWEAPADDDLISEVINAVCRSGLA
ncbi:hypothetical protein SynMEDNS5_01199 [Synechococcus sp. MEDNS5]|uniref:hypothetical protein n=1 Tax=Synechococcus sp. MEDNS5 TaxID=1442554 RepID=UPI0016494FC1|nr:hypothetical protein [Synechococcus sp. MEDNS5]QNJ05925.1 hypothetical protein SynMEDNS5_01199 [Synechococcus sp. MEDNS5]